MPDIEGQTLEGEPFRLADLRGRPVIVNFWGPSCVPCRDEFPLFKAKREQYAADGLEIVGVLMDDPPEPARAFAAEFGAKWPTVIDEGEAARDAYLVAARPMSFFVDPDGVLQSVQVGWLRDEDFDRKYAQIAP